jgi:hypothetical protein
MGAILDGFEVGRSAPLLNVGLDAGVLWEDQSMPPGEAAGTLA